MTLILKLQKVLKKRHRNGTFHLNIKVKKKNRNGQNNIHNEFLHCHYLCLLVENESESESKH